MTVRALDPVTGDIITHGAQFVTGLDEIVQGIQTRLKLFMGEYFRNITEGTPWFQTILGKGGTFTSKEAAIRNRILRSKGVTEILALQANFDIDSRTYSISVSILTTYGATEFLVDGVI